MGNIPESNDGQDGVANQPTMSTGRMLREARERLGMSVMEAAGQIKFAPRQIEALEADDLKRLPEPAFVRGFVRSYAKILHLDAQTLLTALPQPKVATSSELAPVPVGTVFPEGHSAQQQNLIWLGAALMLSVVVVGFAVWHFTSPAKPVSTGQVSENPSKKAQVETPVNLPTQVPDTLAMKQGATHPIDGSVARSSSMTKPITPDEQIQANQIQHTEVADKQHQDKQVLDNKILSKQVQDKKSQSKKVQVGQVLPGQTQPVLQPETYTINPEVAHVNLPSQLTEPTSSSGTTITKIELRLVFDEESWTEIKDKDGKTLSSRPHEPGSQMHMRVQTPLLLVIGHADAVHLFKNGEPVDLAPYINVSSKVARLTLE
jgi:cytoskeleton protein RodZ